MPSLFISLFVSLKICDLRCDGCNSYQEGLKQLSIQTLAPSLCLQLKRFESLRNGGTAVTWHVSHFLAAPCCRRRKFLLTLLLTLTRLNCVGHNGGQQSFKVDTHVVFPAWLNMAPYLSDGGCKSSEFKVPCTSISLRSISVWLFAIIHVSIKNCIDFVL